MSQAGIIDVIGTHPEIPTIFVANVGTAIPIANTIEILGDAVAAHGVPLQTVASGNTININVQYASQAATSVAANAGVASFDSNFFTVDANGFVTFNGSAATESFTVDAFTAPGTNPVLPNGSGNITVTGGQVAAGTTANVIRTNSLAANSYTIQIQRSSAQATTTIGANGVSHFNSSIFTVDANGFVSVSGTALGQTITGQSGGALSPTSGNWNIFGASVAAGTTPVATSGTGSTLTVNVQRAQAIASTNATNVGLAAFNSSFFTVDGNGFVSVSGSTIGQTITGDTGGPLSPTSGNWNILSTATAGSSTSFSGSVSTLRFNVTDSLLNTIIGLSAGNATISGGANCALGRVSLFALTSGSNNTAIGDAALPALTSGGNNTALGSGALHNIVTGSTNLALGSGAGSAYTTSETNNILLGSSGVIGDSATMRLGQSGVTAAAFAAGIVGVTTSNSQMVTINSSTSQLGVAAIPTGNVVGTPPSTDNALARYDSTTGLIIQNSNAIVDDIGNATFNNTTSTTPLSLNVLNSDTNAASSSRIAAAVVAGSAADPFLHVSVNSVTNFCWGIDNSDSDILKINEGAAAVDPSSGTNLWNMTTAGIQTMPLQPAFLAYNSGNVANATGDGTLVSISLDSESFDQGGNFASSTYTSPRTSKVMLFFTVGVFSLSVLHTEMVVAITTTAGAYEVARFNPGVIFSGASQQVTISGGILVPMAAAATAIMQIVVSGSTKTVGITGSLASGVKLSGGILC